MLRRPPYTTRTATPFPFTTLFRSLWAGIQANVTTYEDNVGADLYVAQPGTRNFFGAVSVIPEDTVDAVRADPDVEWAAAVRGFFSITQLHDRKIPTSIRSEERRVGKECFGT